jgi:hypothetical protein
MLTLQTNGQLQLENVKTTKQQKSRQEQSSRQHKKQSNKELQLNINVNT